MPPPELAELQQRIDQGADPQSLRSEIEAAVVARRNTPGDHAAWGHLCEQAGLVSLAFSEYQLALRDQPDDAVVLWKLAQLYRERGDASRARALAARLCDREPARIDTLAFYLDVLREDDALPVARETLDRAVVAGLDPQEADRLRRQHGLARPADPAPRPVQPEIVPAEADCVRMHTLFAGREDVHARQWARPTGETGYSPVHEPLTPAVIRNHLLGNHTVGVYVLRLDATAMFFALDLDIDKPALQKARGNPEFAQQLRDQLKSEGVRLLGALRELGFEPLFENSGYKGRHLWVFLEQPVAGEVLLQLGRGLLNQLAPLGGSGLHLEFFPKQATLKGQGLGNLIKLPLGIHRRTGYRSLFLDDEGQALADQLSALRNAPRCSQRVLFAAVTAMRDVPARPQAPWEGSSAEEESPGTGLSRAAAKEAPPGGSSVAKKVAAPAPPALAAAWTEGDFEADPRVRHLLAHCPVLAELKQSVDQHRQLPHEEQLVLIHSLGHIEGGPQAVNYLFSKCLDVGPEKFMKDRLKGNPVSCPSIRKKIPHVTRRVPCNCPFEFAADRYPTPVLHLLTLPAEKSLPAPVPRGADLESLARRFGVLERRKAEIVAEWEDLRRALVEALSRLPDRQFACDAGAYRLELRDGVEDLVYAPAGHGAASDLPATSPLVSSTPGTDS